MGLCAGTPGNGLFFLFGGMIYDAAAGLYLTKTRAYNPRNGRFLQRDILDESGKNGVFKGFPFGRDAIGTNLYAWCANNPITKVDPSGLEGVSCQEVGAALGATIGGFIGGLLGGPEGAAIGAAAGAAIGGAVGTIVDYSLGLAGVDPGPWYDGGAAYDAGAAKRQREAEEAARQEQIRAYNEAMDAEAKGWLDKIGSFGSAAIGKIWNSYMEHGYDGGYGVSSREMMDVGAGYGALGIVGGVGLFVGGVVVFVPATEVVVAGGGSAAVGSTLAQIRQWLDSGYKVIPNKAGDPIIMSKDGLRKIRFDYLNTHGDLPHVHIEVLKNGKWGDAIPGMHRIYK